MCPRASEAGLQRTSTTVGAGPVRPDFFGLSEFLTLAMSAVQGPTEAKFGADESHEGLGVLPRVAGGGSPPDNGRDKQGIGQGSARKSCRPGNTVCGPGNRLHILRLEDGGPTIILVSDNFLLWSSPQRADLHGNKAILRALRLCVVVFLRKLATKLV